MMSKSIKVKPKEGLKVFNPATKLHIDESGTLIVWSTYWQRRFNDGEIEIVKPEKTIKKKTKSKKIISEGE